MEPNALATIPAGQGTDLNDLSMQQIFWLGNQMAAAGIANGNKAAAQASIKIMAGQVLEIDPVSAQRGIFIMPNGSIGFYANLVASRIKASPKYDYRVDALNDNICTISFFEIVNGKRVPLGNESFTQEDAKRQGTQNMAKFPKNMLFARTMSNGSKFYCPDVMGNYPIYTEADKEIMEANSTPIEPTAAEVVAEEDRARKALGRGSKSKPPKAAEEPVKAPEPEAPAPTPAEAPKAPETAPVAAKPQPAPAPAPEAAPAADYQNDELDRMDLGELSDMADQLKLAGTDNMNAQRLREAVREHHATGRMSWAEAPKAAPQPTGQVEGAPETYMNPAVPAQPEAEAMSFAEPADDDPHTDTQRKRIMAMLNDHGFKVDEEKRRVVAGILSLDQIVSFKTVTYGQAKKLIEALDNTDGAILRGMFIELAKPAEDANAA